MTETPKPYLTPEKYQQICQELAKYYPKCFLSTKDRILKKGIFWDIVNDGKIILSRTQLRKVLCYYTRSRPYIKAHLPGEKRYNLAGKVAGEVTVEEAETVSDKLAKRKEEWQKSGKLKLEK